MNALRRFRNSWLATALTLALALPLQANLITNPGFEAGLSGWTVVDQIGSDGSFFIQSGTLSPVNGLVVPPPPEGTYAAMSDGQGPGSRVLFQDFVVANSSVHTVGFSLFIGNGNGSPDFFTPPTLDFATPALNQRARVDIITNSADPFSLNAADIVMNLFETAPGSPLVSGYNAYLFDASAALQAYQGTTLRLRFAAVDNVAPMNIGVDAVRVDNVPFSVPDGLPWQAPALALTGLLILAAMQSRRRTA